MPTRAFFSATDDDYLVGTVALLNSLKLVGHHEPLFVADGGLRPDLKRVLEQHATVVDPGATCTPHFAKWEIARAVSATEVLAIVDADVIVVRPLTELIDLCADQQRIVVFADDQPDRIHPAWTTHFGGAMPRRHTYVNSGLVLLPGDLASVVLERVLSLQSRINLEQSYAAGVRDQSHPFHFLDQDCLNAVLATSVPESKIKVLDHALAPFQPMESVRIADVRSLRCTVAGGREPYLLHHISDKPWLRDVQPSAYSELLPRLLRADDVTLRLRSDPAVAARPPRGFPAGDALSSPVGGDDRNGDLRQL